MLRTATGLGNSLLTCNTLKTMPACCCFRQRDAPAAKRVACMSAGTTWQVREQCSTSWPAHLWHLRLKCFYHILGTCKDLPCHVRRFVMNLAKWQSSLAWPVVFPCAACQGTTCCLALITMSFDQVDFVTVKGHTRETTRVTADATGTLAPRGLAKYTMGHN
jgi:hypothetical protein